MSHKNSCAVSGSDFDNNGVIKKLQKYNEMLSKKFDKIISLIDDKREHTGLYDKALKSVEDLRIRLRSVEEQLEKQAEVNSNLLSEKETLKRQLSFSEEIIRCFASHFNIDTTEKDGKFIFTVGEQTCEESESNIVQTLRNLEYHHLCSENRLLLNQLDNMRNTFSKEEKKSKESFNQIISDLNDRINEKSRECQKLRKKLEAQQNVIKELTQCNITLMSLAEKKTFDTLQADVKKSHSDINNSIKTGSSAYSNGPVKISKDKKLISFYKSTADESNKKLKSALLQYEESIASYEEKLQKLNEKMKALERSNSTLHRRLAVERSAFKNELHAICREVDDTERLLVKVLFFTNARGKHADDVCMSEQLVEVLERTNNVKECIKIKTKNII